MATAAASITSKRKWIFMSIFSLVCLILSIVVVKGCSFIVSSSSIFSVKTEYYSGLFRGGVSTSYGGGTCAPYLPTTKFHPAEVLARAAGVITWVLLSFAFIGINLTIFVLRDQTAHSTWKATKFCYLFAIITTALTFFLWFDIAPHCSNNKNDNSSSSTDDLFGMNLFDDDFFSGGLSNGSTPEAHCSVGSTGIVAIVNTVLLIILLCIVINVKDIPEDGPLLPCVNRDSSNSNAQAAAAYTSGSASTASKKETPAADENKAAVVKTTRTIEDTSEGRMITIETNYADGSKVVTTTPESGV